VPILSSPISSVQHVLRGVSDRVAWSVSREDGGGLWGFLDRVVSRIAACGAAGRPFLFGAEVFPAFARGGIRWILSCNHCDLDMFALEFHT
jgi:hypothetical protein